VITTSVSKKNTHLQIRKKVYTEYKLMRWRKRKHSQLTVFWNLNVRITNWEVRSGTLGVRIRFSQDDVVGGRTNMKRSHDSRTVINWWSDGCTVINNIVYIIIYHRASDKYEYDHCVQEKRGKYMTLYTRITCISAACNKFTTYTYLPPTPSIIITLIVTKSSRKYTVHAISFDLLKDSAGEVHIARG
jgi:hypothetical protein